MSTAVQTTTELEILESLDFDPEHECEQYNHGKVPWHLGPAKFLVAISGECAGCGYALKPATIALCKPAWDHAGALGLRCPNDSCDHKFKRHEAWSIVAVF